MFVFLRWLFRFLLKLVWMVFLLRLFVNGLVLFVVFFILILS